MSRDRAVQAVNSALKRAADAEAERDAAREQVRALREAVDDLWGCIRSIEIPYLQPSTRRLAQEVHDLVWHEEATDDR